MRNRTREILALGLILLTLMGAVITGGTSGTNVEVDAISKAMRVTPYDSRGNNLGQLASYSAGLTLRTNTAAGTGPFFSICGSGSKIVRVKRFNVNGTVATTGIRAEVVLKRTSTATSGGTATTLTASPHDSNSPAATATLVNFYTVLATAGASTGVAGIQFQNWPITATIASTDQFPGMSWDFRGLETEPITLRGTTQCFEANFGTTTTNAPTLIVGVTWTEDTN